MDSWYTPTFPLPSRCAHSHVQIWMCPTIMKIGIHKSPISTFVKISYAAVKLLMRSGIYRHADAKLISETFRCISAKKINVTKVKFHLSMPWRHIGGAVQLHSFLTSAPDRWVVNFTLLPLYTREKKKLVPIEEEAVCAPQLVWAFSKKRQISCPYRIRTLDRPVITFTVSYTFQTRTIVPAVFVWTRNMVPYSEGWT